ncbi:MAG: NAD(P)/FAD-dependent oxidoreductase [Victivallales bacterium]|nr:NAD(P)/FAD-dependent oxidoreductase [Victivallales bacterium]
MKYDTVIIGAGMSGLAAGIRLAHFDKKVLICERHYREGGLNSYYDRNNFKLETGLHAMTNFVPRGAPKSMPLMKILRQLKIPYDALELREQRGSSIVFPGHMLEFSNDYAEFLQSVAEQFPAEMDNLNRLDRFIVEHDATRMENGYISARKVIGEYITDPLLTDMILCPLMYYGSANERDMDLAQFVLLYRSVFHEGFCRPASNGIEHIIKLLKQRYQESGGELRLNCGISSIKSSSGKVCAVETATGEIIETDHVLSSAGAFETFSICEEKLFGEMLPLEGQLAFMESMVIPRADFDFKTDKTIVFFNNADSFDFSNPLDMCDYRSGIICFPHNFKFNMEDSPPEKMLRVSLLANSRAWHTMSKEEYAENKKTIALRAVRIAESVLGLKDDVLDGARLTDSFTPRTVTRFTGKINGAIYGSPTKYKDGRTGIDGLYLCGTDQGFLGITGAMLSGISIANTYLML